MVSRRNTVGINNNGALQTIRNTERWKNVSKVLRDKEMNEESKKTTEKCRKGDKEKMEWGIENGRDRERETERDRRGTKFKKYEIKKSEVKKEKIGEFYMSVM